MDGNLKDSINELLKFGTCVKECPSDTGDVLCYKTGYMSTDPLKKNFDKCVYAYKVNICPPTKTKAECE